MAGGPFDYITPAAQANPFASAIQGFGIGQQLVQQQQQSQLAQQQLKAQMDLQRQYQQDASSLLTNPNAGARDFAAFQLKYPQFKDATKGAFDKLSDEQKKQQLGEAVKVSSALAAGRKDVALASIDQRIKAMENSGANPQEINAIKGVRQTLDILPDDQALNASLMYGSTIDPDFAKNFAGIRTEARAQQEQPFKTQKLQGEAQQAASEGQFRSEKLQAEIDNVRSQIGERSAKLGLDRDKFNLDFDTKLEELRGKQVVKPSAGMEKVQADAVAAAGVADQTSTNAAQLADKFANAGAGYGGVAKASEFFKRLVGNEDDLTALRKQYIAIKNQGALSMLPPGPASDKDIQTVQAAFLPETADTKQIADWLKSFSNVQKAVAARENARADWISEVGSTGTTKRDIEVQGIQVPAGTSFNDFVKRGLKVGEPEKPAAAPAAATPRYLDPNSWRTTTTSSGATAVSPNAVIPG